MNDSAEWIDHINSESHRNMLLNRHKVQRDPGDFDPGDFEPGDEERDKHMLWSAPHSLDDD